MGLPIACHLARGGFEVLGLDVNEERLAAAQKVGIALATSASDLAARSELVIILAAYEEQVWQAIFGPAGLVEGAEPGAIIAIASTISPVAMQRIGARLAERGIITLDLPICRGEAAAEEGKLLAIGGGDQEAFQACRPAFETFSDSIHYLGELGAGQVGKMVNNLILWACISANTEGFKLAGLYGVDQVALRDMLLESSAQNWAMTTKIDDQPMPWAEKDMMIVLSEADRLRVSLPLCGSIKEVIKGIKLERGQ
jgi:3-hydroxyisobutyrate dehydrogenase-like beta-hydroxyacid dehydrogenase